MFHLEYFRNQISDFRAFQRHYFYHSFISKVKNPTLSLQCPPGCERFASARCHRLARRRGNARCVDERARFGPRIPRGAQAREAPGRSPAPRSAWPRLPPLPAARPAWISVWPRSASAWDWPPARRGQTTIWTATGSCGSRGTTRTTMRWARGGPRSAPAALRQLSWALPAESCLLCFKAGYGLCLGRIILPFLGLFPVFVHRLSCAELLVSVRRRQKDRLWNSV